MSEVNSSSPIECRFATHVKSKVDRGRDLHVIKEQTHNKDGTVTPNLRLVYN